MDKTKVIQIGILVKDIVETTRAWAEFLGCETPEPSITEAYQVTHAVYQGKPCRGRIWQTAFQMENLEIELISPVDGEPSFWKDSLDRDGEGLHHIAFYTRDMQGELARLNQSGFVTIQQGSWPESPRDGYYAYADTRDKLKCTVELLDYMK